MSLMSPLLAGGVFTASATWEALFSVSVQSLSHVRLFATPWTSACQLPCPSALLSSLLLLPSVFSSIRVFSNESVIRNRWPKYWSFSFNISPSNEYSGLISFRMTWLGLLAVQETLKSLHQYQSSILWHQFFGTQLYL